MIADSSALIAVLRGEPEADEFRELIAAHVTRVSAVAVLETSIVMTGSRHHEVDNLLADAEISVVPFDAAQATLARAAYARFGKKSGSKANLNFGDATAYALAKVTGEPLLFKGDDFTHTDIPSART